MKRKNVLRSVVMLLLCTVVMLFSTSAIAGPSGKLTMFHAGSLSVPLAAMEKTFEAKYPGVDLQREASGSQKCARKITDVGKPCDIMASADYKVIDKLLIPDYADWNIRFATNQLVLCYTDKSAYADTVNVDNWYKILQKKGVYGGILIRISTPAVIVRSW